MKLTDEMLKQATAELSDALVAQVEREMDEQLLQELRTPAKLTPSPAGRECLGNGTWPGYECQCDNCPNFLECFSESV